MGPAALMLMHIDEPSGSLTPSQVAFALENDPAYLAAQILHDEEQSVLATENAHAAAREDHPDQELIDVGLHEARAWATDASMKRAALAWLRDHPEAEPTPFAFEHELRAVRRTSWAFSNVRRRCTELCGRDADICLKHRRPAGAARARQDAAVAALRTRFLDQCTAHGQ